MAAFCLVRTRRVVRVHSTGLRIISSLPRRSLCAKAGHLVGQAPYHLLPTRRSLRESGSPMAKTDQKISLFKFFWELRPEFPGKDSEWQNNYPKGTTQIESNILRNKPIHISIKRPRKKVLTSPFPRSTSTLILITLALACFALSPGAQAVSPAPDGGYPGGNTAEGENALFSLTTGPYNTATGNHALYSNTTGGPNTATGGYALASNTTGSNNTASGFDALGANTTGWQNTAIGALALLFNTTGDNNTAMGVGALQTNTTGVQNIAVGSFALDNNTSGSYNISLGYYAGLNLTTGNNNIDIGNLGVAGEANTIRIGTAGTQTAAYIAGIAGATVTGNPVVIDGSGHLGTADISTLQGPQGAQGNPGSAGPQGPAGATGATGAVGPQGPVGATGAPGDPGATGPQGPAGAGLVSGAFLTLPSTAPAPAGFTLLGTTTITYRDGHNVIHDSTLNLYQKN